MLNTPKAMGEGNYFYLYPFGGLVHKAPLRILEFGPPSKEPS